MQGCKNRYHHCYCYLYHRYNYNYFLSLTTRLPIFRNIFFMPIIWLLIIISINITSTITMIIIIIVYINFMFYQISFLLQNIVVVSVTYKPFSASFFPPLLSTFILGLSDKCFHFMYWLFFSSDFLKPFSPLAPPPEAMTFNIRCFYWTALPEFKHVHTSISNGSLGRPKIRVTGSPLWCCVWRMQW